MRARASDNASVQGVRAGSELCGFARTGARRARTTCCSRYRGRAPTDFEQKRDCFHSTSLRIEDAFPVVPSLPPKNSCFSEGERRRPEMRLLFAGYHSTCLNNHSNETSLAKYLQMVSVFSTRNSWMLLGVKKLNE